MKIQIFVLSLLRGLTANSFLWILPEAFYAYTRIFSPLHFWCLTTCVHICPSFVSSFMVS